MTSEILLSLVKNLNARKDENREMHKRAMERGDTITAGWLDIRWGELCAEITAKLDMATLLDQQGKNNTIPQKGQRKAVITLGQTANMHPQKQRNAKD